MNFFKRSGGVLVLFLKVIILGIVEGLTEFLPVSSTGHLILLERWLTLEGSPGFAETFMIVIQLPAILAVVLYFWSRLFPFHPKADTAATFHLWIKIGIAFLPAAVFGILLDDLIESWFFNPLSVSLALIVGGVVLLLLEYKRGAFRLEQVSDIGFKVALGIGIFQCLAMMPGTSRSAATIIGAMLLGASRPAAAEFSFFLAIPTMLGATVYKTLKSGLVLNANEWMLIAIGGLVSFITAYIVVAAFMNYIRRYSFRPFGYYRIVLGILILLLLVLDI
jgi:undecaprenyl-diphosphatase